MKKGEQITFENKSENPVENQPTNPEPEAVENNPALVEEVKVQTQCEEAEAIFTAHVTNWFRDKGDLTHRITYDGLTEDSLVLDIGGYFGEWTSNIYSKYNCKVRIFEPVKEYFDYIESRFSKNKKIDVFNFGFSNVEKDDIISIANDASSLYLDFHRAEAVKIIKLKNFNEYMDGCEVVDLVKINIEGCEYDLLDSLSDENIKKLRNIQVQFHVFMKDCVTRRNNIRSRLSATHRCTYDYAFVWENWELIETE